MKNTNESDIKISEKEVLNSEKTTNPEVIATVTDPSNSELAKHTKKEDEIASSLANSTNELEELLAQKEKDKKEKNHLKPIVGKSHQSLRLSFLVLLPMILLLMQNIIATQKLTKTA